MRQKALLWDGLRRGFGLAFASNLANGRGCLHVNESPQFGIDPHLIERVR